MSHLHLLKKIIRIALANNLNPVAIATSIVKEPIYHVLDKWIPDEPKGK